MAENGQDNFDPLKNIAGSRPSSAARDQAQSIVGTMHWFAYVGPDPPLPDEEDRETRLRNLKEKQNEERQKKLEEIKAQALAAQRYKEQKEQERRLRLEELRYREDARRAQVEERKRAINEAERDRLESILRRNQEREARIEARKRNDRSSNVFAFGSSTPRMLEPVESMTSSFWGHRRATSTQNITCTAAPLTRRQSERELDGGSKKRATSAGGLERSGEGTPPQTPAGCASGYVGRRRTDLMPTIPSKDSPSSGNRKPFTRSPAPSRPSSSLSQQSTSSVTSSVNMRTRPVAAPRRPRPVSIAVTGVTTDRSSPLVDRNTKPPLPKSRKSSCCEVCPDEAAEEGPPPSFPDKPPEPPAPPSIVERSLSDEEKLVAARSSDEYQTARSHFFSAMLLDDSSADVDRSATNVHSFVSDFSDGERPSTVDADVITKERDSSSLVKARMRLFQGDHSGLVDRGNEDSVIIVSDDNKSSSGVLRESDVLNLDTSAEDSSSARGKTKSVAALSDIIVVDSSSDASRDTSVDLTDKSYISSAPAACSTANTDRSTTKIDRSGTGVDLRGEKLDLPRFPTVKTDPTTEVYGSSPRTDRSSPKVDRSSTTVDSLRTKFEDSSCKRAKIDGSTDLQGRSTNPGDDRLGLRAKFDGPHSNIVGSTAKSYGSGAKVDCSGTKVDFTGTEVEFTSTEVDFPRGKLDSPVVKDAPTTKPHDSETKAVADDDSRTKFHGPTANVVDSGTKVDYSSGKIDDSNVKGNDLSTKIDGSSVKVGRASTKVDDPGSAVDSGAMVDGSNTKAGNSGAKVDDFTADVDNSGSVVDDSSSKVVDSNSKVVNSGSADSNSKSVDSGVNFVDSSANFVDSNLKIDRSSAQVDNSSTKVINSEAKVDNSSEKIDGSAVEIVDSNLKVSEASTAKVNDPSTKMYGSSSKDIDPNICASTEISNVEDSNVKAHDSGTVTKSKVDESSAKIDGSNANALIVYPESLNPFESDEETTTTPTPTKRKGKVGHPKVEERTGESVSVSKPEPRLRRIKANADDFEFKRSTGDTPELLRKVHTKRLTLGPSGVEVVSKPLLGETENEGFNPFGDDEEEELDRKTSEPEIRKSSYEKSLNPFGDDEEDDEAPVNEVVDEPPKLRKIRPSPDEFLFDRSVGDTPEGLRTLYTKRMTLGPSGAEEPARTVLKGGRSAERLNPFGSDDEEETDFKRHTLASPERGNLTSRYGSSASISSGTSSIQSTRKKKPAPRPPLPAEFHLSPQQSPIPSLRGSPKPRKNKRAPPPPTSTPLPKRDATIANESPSTLVNSCDVVSSFKAKIEETTNDSSFVSLESEDYENEKVVKDEVNRNRQNQTGNERNFAPNKSTYGKWKRKKGQAPTRPVPEKRTIKALPTTEVRRELDIIEVQQQGLERQGVRLEEIIRERCEGPGVDPDAAVSIETEDLILQLFEVVNEKNELCRRQAELMYLQRQQRLEEEHAEVEYQIRCLMLRPALNKTDHDKAREEELIGRLVEIVERRNEIIECLEIDRIREAEEDDSISVSLNNYAAKREENVVEEQRPSKTKKSKKKFKKFKFKSSPKVDADKDVDESESSLSSTNSSTLSGKERKKEKKFRLF